MKQRKKIIKIIFLIAVVFLMISLAVTLFLKSNVQFLAKSEQENRYALTSLNGNWYYELNDDSSVNILEYRGSETDVTIPRSINGTVTSLNTTMLWGTGSGTITDITIPDTITNVANGNTYNKGNIQSINVASNNSQYSSEDGVLFNKDKTELIRYPEKKIGTTYNIPNTVTVIGKKAFMYCENLENLEIPESVTKIENGAFDECKKLKSIKIPASVTSIEYYPFNNCTSLTSINVDSSNQYFASVNGVLFNKEKEKIVKYPEGKIEKVYTIPSSVTSIEDFAFNNCTSLTSIEIPSSVTSIGGGAFNGCTSLTSIEIPSSVTEIKYRAFDGCTSLTSIEIPSSVRSIRQGTFKYCTSLTSIEIPSSVTSIAYESFNKCTSLTSIKIPSSVTNIQKDAFVGCNDLTIYCKSGSTAHQYAIDNNIPYKLIDRTLESISIKTKPSKTTYIQGESLNLAGGVLTLTYNDNTTETVSMTDSKVTTSGFNSTTTGTKTITVSYGGKSTTFTVTVNAKTLSSISVKTKPSKTTYIQGESLNLAGGVLTLTYNNNTTETVSMTDSKVTTSGFNSTTAGTKTITVSYGGKTTTFTVTVNAKTLSSISVKTKPSKTTYIQGENLDLAGGVLTLTYNDNTTETVNMTDSKVTTSGFNNTTLGKQTITVSYERKTTTFDINIIQNINYEENEDGGITITGGNETEVIIPEEINGKSVTEIGDKAFADRDDLISVDIPDSVTKIADSAFEGSDDVTIICNSGSKAEDFAKEKDMNYILKDKTVDSISIKKEPTKTTYVKDEEELDLKGGRILLKYTDGDTSPISMKFTGVKVTGYDKTKAGQQELTVTFREKTTTFNVTVNAKDKPILGDISGDGKVDSTDLLLLKRHIIAGNKTEWVLKEDKFTRGDMNTDGTINSTDLLLLKRKIINR